MEQIKRLTIILFFLLLISTVVSIGAYSVFGFKIFTITLGSTFILSAFFILFMFISIMIGGSKA